jgi:DNA-binding XRE family transcriptional regulator
MTPKAKSRIPRRRKERDVPPSLLTQTRKSRGLSLETVAEAVGTHHTNLLRIEHGDQVPRPDVAQRIFDFFDGVVPLQKIFYPYDTPPACPMCQHDWNGKTARVG